MNAATAVRRPQGALWIALYIALVAFPLVILLLGGMPKGGGYWWDFSMALGFGGLAIMGLQSILTARFRRATAPFGMDIIYYFHRWIAVGGFLLIVAHYVILRVGYAGAIGPLSPLAAPWHMTAGRIALVLFGVLIVSSLWRKAFRLEYDGWRIGHAIMAVAAVVLSIVHIQGVGHYTQEPWKGTLWGAYAALWVLVVVYVRLARPWSLLRRPYRVSEVRKERGRTWTLTLRPEGHDGIQFQPGQFAWLSLRASPFRAKEHPFSFSGSAAEAGTLRFTIKELGDFTRTIGTVKPGERAYVDGPHGAFTPDRHPDAPGFVFIAGGVGMAPIMSMLRTLADRGDPRPMLLVFGNRQWEDVLFREEIDDLRGRLQLKVAYVLEEPSPEWPGLRGLLTEEVLREAIPTVDTGRLYFVCGPKPMTDSVQRALRNRGVPLSRIHFELFEMA